LALTPGTRLGVYEVIASIGVGGMGEVYRARDTKLNRDVALKVISDTFALDPDRLARFRREAQVLASLNHPHIAAIHGFEDRGDTHALVLELVEGEPLADRIARGAIPLDEALPIARQIAEALEAAHDQGIIHRDLKPSNIKITPDGNVKVLDFGLAKLTEGGGPGRAGEVHLTQSPTITSPAQMTGVGVILGTAAYMAPEQAKGQAADKRADVWAFGAVVFEMLTGQRLFTGETISDTLASVLKNEPNWRTLPAATPTAVRRLLRRCLEKDRKRRLDSAADAGLEIEEALTAPSATDRAAGQPGAALRSAWARALPWAVVAALATGLALMLVLWAPSRARPSRPPARGPDDQRHRSRPAPGPLTRRDARRLHRQQWHAVLRPRARRARTSGDCQRRRLEGAIRLAGWSVGRLHRPRTP
jgi:eukaryotic-like serine/threonine-protein kinase